MHIGRVVAHSFGGFANKRGYDAAAQTLSGAFLRYFRFGDRMLLNSSDPTHPHKTRMSGPPATLGCFPNGRL